MLALRRKGRPAQARDCQLNYPTPCGHIIAGIGTYGTVVRRARTAFYLFIFAVPIVPRGFSTCWRRRISWTVRSYIAQILILALPFHSTFLPNTLSCPRTSLT